MPSEIVHPNTHNELFSTLAEIGFLGVISLTVLYFGSGLYNWRNSDDPIISSTATMSLVVTFGTIVFGLTIVFCVDHEYDVLCSYHSHSVGHHRQSPKHTALQDLSNPAHSVVLPPSRDGLLRGSVGMDASAQIRSAFSS